MFNVVVSFHVTVLGLKSRRLSSPAKNRDTIDLMKTPLLFLLCALVNSLSGPATFVARRYASHQRPKNALSHIPKHASSPSYATADGHNANMTSASTSKGIDQIRTANLDAMRARAGNLRRSILQQQMELQQLEREIICCSHPSSRPGFLDHPIQTLSRTLNQTATKFFASTDVLAR